MLGFIIILLLIIIIIVVIYQYTTLAVDIVDGKTTKEEVKIRLIPILGILIILYRDYKKLDDE